MEPHFSIFYIYYAHCFMTLYWVWNSMFYWHDKQCTVLLKYWETTWNIYHSVQLYEWMRWPKMLEKCVDQSQCSSVIHSASLPFKCLGLIRFLSVLEISLLKTALISWTCPCWIKVCFSFKNQWYILVYILILNSLWWR